MKAYGWIGLLLLIVSELLLFFKIEPVYSWFYCFAWWSYILVADAVLYKLGGSSLLTTRRAEFWRMLPLSVFVWLLFEFYNFFIGNWAYDGVPAQMWIRWPGYFAAFATVLPGVFVTSDLAAVLLFGRTPTAVPSGHERLDEPAAFPYSRIMLAFGFAFSVAPIIWPRYFFPTVWLGPIFLFDPLLEKFGIRSMSRAIASGDRRRVWSLMLGGLICGALWEFWNFWTPSRWVYNVPFFSALKVFEMPLLGFLGFPPFALECWILYHLLTAVLRRSDRVAVRVMIWLAIGLASLAVIMVMDHRTVLTFS